MGKANALAAQLIATLPSGIAGLFNPYRDHCPMDAPGNGPEQKTARLAAHLDRVPRFVCVGEGPGYQGARYSGVAFTSERLLIEGAIPGIAAIGHRLSVRGNPFSEPSATIVWTTLYRLQIAENTLLWNCVQLHPHRLGEPWSNRTPTPDEVAIGQPALRLLKEAFPEAHFVAVGAKAKAALETAGIAAMAVRHPANGGASLFAQGMAKVIEQAR